MPLDDVRRKQIVDSPLDDFVGELIKLLQTPMNRLQFLCGAIELRFLQFLSQLKRYVNLLLQSGPQLGEPLVVADLLCVFALPLPRANR